MITKTVTEAQINLLRQAREMAEECKYGGDPEGYDEFDDFIKSISQAIAQVSLDRKRLRAVLRLMELLPAPKHLGPAYDKWRELEKRNAGLPVPKKR